MNIPNPYMDYHSNPFMNLRKADPNGLFRNITVGTKIKYALIGSSNVNECIVYKIDFTSGNIIANDGKAWHQTLMKLVGQVEIVTDYNPFMEI